MIRAVRPFAETVPFWFGFGVFGVASYLANWPLPVSFMTATAGALLWVSAGALSEMARRLPPDLELGAD